MFHLSVTVEDNFRFPDPMMMKLDAFNGEGKSLEFGMKGTW